MTSSTNEFQMLGTRHSSRRDPFLGRPGSWQCSELLILSQRSKIVGYEKTNTLEPVSVQCRCRVGFTTLCWCAGVCCFVSKRVLH